MRDVRAKGYRDRLAFRRRCGWCGVRLRGWQRNMCRRCYLGVSDPWGGPPCGQGSRWDAEPDEWMGL